MTQMTFPIGDYEDLSDAVDELDVMVKELEDELEMVKDRVARIRRHLRTVISYILEKDRRCL